MFAVKLESIEVTNNYRESFKIEFNENITKIITSCHAGRNWQQVSIEEVIDFAFGRDNGLLDHSTILIIYDGARRLALKRVADNYENSQYFINNEEVHRQIYVENIGISYDTGVGLITPEYIRCILNQDHSLRLRIYLERISDNEGSALTSIDTIEQEMKRVEQCLKFCEGPRKLFNNLKWNFDKITAKADDYLKYRFYNSSVQLETLCTDNVRSFLRPIPRNDVVRIVSTQNEVQKKEVLKAANQRFRICLADSLGNNDQERLSRWKETYELAGRNRREVHDGFIPDEILDQHAKLDAKYKLEVLAFLNQQQIVQEKPMFIDTSDSYEEQGIRLMHDAKIRRLEHRVSLTSDLSYAQAACTLRLHERSDEANNLYANLMNYRNATRNSIVREKCITLDHSVLHGRVFGRLSDFCRPKHANDAIAITLALSKYKSMLFVENNRVRTEVIDMLKQANFKEFSSVVSLQALKFSPPRTGFQQGYRRLIDIIDIDDRKLKNIVASILDNDVVCDDSDSAIHTAREYPELRVISCDGIEHNTFDAIHMHYRNSFDEKCDVAPQIIEKMKIAANFHYPNIYPDFNIGIDEIRVRNFESGAMRLEMNDLRRKKNQIEASPISHKFELSQNASNETNVIGALNERLITMKLKIFKAFWEKNNTINREHLRDDISKWEKKQIHLLVGRDIQLHEANERNKKNRELLREDLRRYGLVSSAELEELRENIVNISKQLLEKQHGVQEAITREVIKSINPNDRDVEVYHLLTEQAMLAKRGMDIGVPIDLRDQYSGRANYNKLPEYLRLLGGPYGNIEERLKNMRDLEEDYNYHVGTYGHQTGDNKTLLMEMMIDLERFTSTVKQKWKQLRKELNTKKKQHHEQYNKFFDNVSAYVEDIFKEIMGSPYALARLQTFYPDDPTLKTINLAFQSNIEKRTTTFNKKSGIMAAIALQLAIAKSQKWPLILIDLVDLNMSKECLDSILRYVGTMENMPQIIFINDTTDILRRDDDSIYYSWMNPADGLLVVPNRIAPVISGPNLRHSELPTLFPRSV